MHGSGPRPRRVAAGLLGLTILLFLGSCGDEGTNRPNGEPPPAGLPDFLCAVRGYGGGEVAGSLGEEQCRILRELGVTYVQGFPDFTWGNLERGGDVMKWEGTDRDMDRLAAWGLKTIAFVICPKEPGLPWDSTIARDTPLFRAEYEEFAYLLAQRYSRHPAWSGVVAAWGGSSDIFADTIRVHRPEVVVPLQNAAYSGIKRASSGTIVVSFNMATTGPPAAEWRDWHERAFALDPKMDWFGVQSHMVPPTVLREPDAVEGLAGLVQVRAFLDEHGYAGVPIFLNEGGFDIRLGEDVHAQYVAETYTMARTLDIDLRGWLYFALFGRDMSSDEGVYGLMTSLEESNPPLPRPAWHALRSLIRTARFFEYDHEARVSGAFNDPAPVVHRFALRGRTATKLWTVFAPRLGHEEPDTEEVVIRVAPGAVATRIDLYGRGESVAPDSAGALRVRATAAPTYVLADGP